VKSATYDVLNEFSKAHKRRVRFVQIGASDGLHSDPIREFIVRDHWSGVLVEPLPASFARLQDNYGRLGARDLTFVNAAIVARDTPSTSFWTFDDAFLAGLSDEQRLDHVQKSSFNPAHVQGYLGGNANAEQRVVEIPVDCLSLPDLMDGYFSLPGVDILVTDCEGYEATLLPAIDWGQFRPTAVLFESHNLGGRETVVNNVLVDIGYVVYRLGGDSFAVKGEFLKDWRRRSKWAQRNLTDPAAPDSPACLTPVRHRQIKT
jgi:FkbM family methyltransferase